MKLIPLSDFVEKYIPPVISDNQSSDVDKLLNNLKLISNYTKFLKQPLTLGMFIPLDEEGNVLESPYLEHVFHSHYKLPVKFSNVTDDYVKKYDKYKEKVLFKGLYKTGMFDKPISEMTVEDLIKFEFELTPSALETIGIK